MKGPGGLSRVPKDSMIYFNTPDAFHFYPVILQWTAWQLCSVNMQRRERGMNEFDRST